MMPYGTKHRFPHSGGKRAFALKYNRPALSSWKASRDKSGLALGSSKTSTSFLSLLKIVHKQTEKHSDNSTSRDVLPHLQKILGCSESVLTY